MKIEDIQCDTIYDPDYDSGGLNIVKNLIWFPVTDKMGELRGIKIFSLSLSLFHYKLSNNYIYN